MAVSQSLTGKKIFGAGRFFGINAVTNPTPMRAFVPQDQSIDFKLATKSLNGEERLPVAVAAGDMSITGKVTLGANSARMFGDLIFAVASTTGQINSVNQEGGTIPGTPFAVTVVNGATWTTDLGVTKADGTPFTRVASAPATGQYSVGAGGVYTFAAADTGIAVLISYLWTTTGGEKMTLANSLQGPAGSFTGVMVFPYGTEQDVLTLNNCISSGAGISTKQGDFAKPTFDFMSAADANDLLGTFSFAEAA